jgi:hypothetical protein
MRHSFQAIFQSGVMMRTRDLLLMCLFAAGAFAQPAIPAFTRNYSFPPVGLASSETAQLNVVNIATGSTATNEAPACTGTITFANAGGKAIGTPTSFTTTGSQISSTQLTFSQLQLASTDTRGEFVASVQVTHTTPGTAPCSLVFSLETFDTSSGVTHVYLGNSATGTALVGNLAYRP